jgi:parvulin-like peptidyl-prolyl isomerase
MTSVALTVNDDSATLAEVMRVAKWRGQLEFLTAAADALLIRQEAARRGLAVSNDELQKAADQFRIERSLYDAASLRAWLENNRFDINDWETMLEQDALTRKVRDALTENQVEGHYASNRLHFESADISRIVVQDEGLARELKAQVTEDGADFHDLARRYTHEETTRLAGGYAGAVKRKELGASIESAVFGAAPGKIVGPFKANKMWTLIKVERLNRAPLDDALRDHIKEELFQEWLVEKRRKAKMSIALLELNE